MIPTSTPLVSYNVGMFAWDESSLPSIWGELEATRYHEAAHAVAMYGFGLGLGSIGVWENHFDAQTVAFGGLVMPISRAGRARVHIGYGYRRSHFVQGCVTGAGPAGERRYRHLSGLPMRIRGASADDHQAIDSRAKELERRGRDRFAYQRMVWYAAQKIVSRDDFWGAVVAVAELFDDAVGDEAPNGAVWTYLKPRDVYRACREQGVTRGLLNQAA